MFSNFIKDVQKVHKWFVNKHYINPKRIGLAGFSMGGQLAILMAADTSLIEAVCLVSVPDNIANTDLGKDWGDTKNSLIKTSSMYGKISIPYNFYSDCVKYDVSNFVGKIKCPKLFIVGEKDTNVYPELTQKLYDNAGKPKEIIKIQGMDHFYKKHSKILKKVNKKITNFFFSYL